MTSTAVHWFRRDFRVRDNTGLLAAAKDADAVVGLFVIDPQWFHGSTGKMGPHQAAFWLESLRALERSLDERGIPLVVRTHRDPVAAALAVVKEVGAARLTLNKEYEPDQMGMDERLEVAAQEAGVRVESYKDSVIFEEEEVLTGTASVYAVFTPYKNAYLKKLAAMDNRVAVGGLVRKLPERRRVKSEGVPTPEKLGFSGVTLDIAPGEKAGAQLLAKFCTQRIGAYRETRDLPALGLKGESTSRLSAHLNAGTVSIRQAMAAALTCVGRGAASDAGVSTWIGELVWRDFYRMILFHFPATVSTAYQKGYAHVTWENRPAHIDAWSEGRTGYPLVDAAMRQLRETGFMHNRLRMIAAMFLTKDLDVHWVIGERLFMRWLMDYDQACNVGGWQWAASTGTDAAPYFRVMNPVLQSQRYDAEGQFIRHFLPALKKVPTKYIHAPWEMPVAVQQAAGCAIGKDYPAPIVEHAVAKVKAIAKFRKKVRH